MGMNAPRLLISAALAALAACSTAPHPAPGPTPSPSRPQDACPILASSDWAAWINAMPGPNARPTLIITGKVTTPGGGWDFVWRTSVMESYPVQVAIDLEPLIPEGGTQAVATREVRHELPIAPPVGAVTVRCGGRTLARISPVEAAH